MSEADTLSQRERMTRIRTFQPRVVTHSMRLSCRPPQSDGFSVVTDLGRLRQQLRTVTCSASGRTRLGRRIVGPQLRSGTVPPSGEMG